MRFLAHKDGIREQTLKEHLENAALICSENLRSIDKSVTYLTGLLHDIGKYQKDFQDKLKGKVINVDHSTVGAKYIFEQNPELPINQMIAYAISGHHTGIPDGGCPADTETSSLISRLKKQFPDISCNIAELDYRNMFGLQMIKGENLYNRYPMYIRMLYSALVDADFIDTESFINGKKERGYHASFAKLLDSFNTYIKRFDGKLSAISKARKNLSDQVVARAGDEQNIFQLDMPTGSGKTLTSMRFALERAIKLNKKRIIYVIPYTSIIEQNARVFKDIFGENLVLEHHSNYESDKLDSDDMDRYELTTENWDAPIVVTTNVQFFESIYSNRSSKLRKLHNIEDSIICFDEAQIIPLKLFNPCMEAIAVLCSDFGVSAVLMSATIPNFAKYCPSLKVCEDLVKDKTDYPLFKRCGLLNLGVVSEDNFATEIDYNRSNLIIVNTKNEARQLYENIPTTNKIHLSTFQTPYDRQIIISNIREILNKEEPITVISTSLIEAGVDLDFDCVYREINGIDSILQAAGRCNREGKKNNCNTFIFETQETAKIRDKDTLLKISITRSLLAKNQNIDSEYIIKEYFDRLFMLQAETRESMNFAKYVKPLIWNYLPTKTIPFISISFAEYATMFKYIDGDTISIVIGVNEEALRLIEKSKYYLSKDIRRKLQRFTVSVYKNVFNILYKSGAILKTEKDIYYITEESFYSPDKGIIYNDTGKENYYVL